MLIILLKGTLKKKYYATVGTKYQIVIPKEIRQQLKIKQGSKLNVDVLDEHTIELRVVPKNWSDQNYGALKKYWQGINMTEEVEKIRDESNIKI
ncbi:hypothetical protein A3I48_01580 [Candidatus Daviesbacteria bacterium RIFCSPLOWO2_02_FULL_36_7]|uniref:SpoVT-AbrB domain-containing protein n=1 Tax=Candidatus Daviesbacteria bacterium RIFCSPLOWO2_02_FULL_36_7 TaxID=1797792 RepID=A0A1F5MHG5_9BACT|nr:MAG: hypothetical protein A3I48_01580 [Candidatus Daviesbacteria bacterium RIFCSPLOWO2_02_FULL_36_7]